MGSIEQLWFIWAFSGILLVVAVCLLSIAIRALERRVKELERRLIE